MATENSNKKGMSASQKAAVGAGAAAAVAAAALGAYLLYGKDGAKKEEKKFAGQSLSHTSPFDSLIIETNVFVVI